MNEHDIYPLTLYFDSQCPMCRTEMQQLQARDANGALRFVDICAPDFACPLPGVRQADLLRLMHARRADGQVVVGVELAVIGLVDRDHVTVRRQSMPAVQILDLISGFPLERGLHLLGDHAAAEHPREHVTDSAL